jgi:hypothetical protein
LTSYLVRPFAEIRKGRTAVIDLVSGFTLPSSVDPSFASRVGYELT